MYVRIIYFTISFYIRINVKKSLYLCLSVFPDIENAQLIVLKYDYS